MNFNKEQLEAINCEDKNIVCIAGAGTGKTQTLIGRMIRLINEGVSPDNILCLTFTRAAATEMGERYRKLSGEIKTPMFATFHAFCYHLLCVDSVLRNYLGYNKVPDIADEISIQKFVEKIKIINNIKIPDNVLSGKKKPEPRQEFEYKLFQKALNKEIKSNNLITFDILCESVCELFTSDNVLCDIYKKKYKHIFVDEFQDTDPLQWKFVQSFTDSCIFVTGDAYQCQPAGTMITMSDFTIKPIEDICVGDSVLTYVCNEARYVSNKNNANHPHRYTKSVIGISKHFACNVVKVASASHSSRYTKDHITYAKIHYEGNEQKHVTYLMSNNLGWYRVGSTRLFLSNGAHFGPRNRMQAEHANNVWILGVYDTAGEAWMQEQMVAYKFGIPQITWVHENVKFNIDDMAKLYQNLGDLTEAASECLQYYGRDINYPLFGKHTNNLHFSKSHIFECRVGNLIEGIFDIVVPQHNSKDKLHNTYEVITSISPEPYQIVYGLEVEKNHNYVGDSILTHNCIYHFRGTDSTIIKSLTKNSAWETIKLFRNYRSTEQICEYANNFTKTYGDESYRLKLLTEEDGEKVIEIRKNPEVKDGYDFTRYDEYIDAEVCDDIQSKLIKYPNGKSAILCRTNREVKYLRNNFKELTETNSSALEILENCLKCYYDEQYRIDYISSLLTKDEYAKWMKECIINKAQDINSPIIQSNDKARQFILYLISIAKIIDDNRTDIEKICDILYEFEISYLPDMRELANKSYVEYLYEIIDRLKSQEKSLYIGTIHSSKGLEYDNVYLVNVDNDTFPLDDEENKNLFYVGVTRAKSNLFIYWG